MALYAYNKTANPLSMVNGLVVLPASKTAGTRGVPFNVTSKLKNLTLQQYQDIESQRVAQQLDISWTGDAEYSTPGLFTGLGNQAFVSELLKENVNAQDDTKDIPRVKVIKLLSGGPLHMPVFGDLGICLKDIRILDVSVCISNPVLNGTVSLCCSEEEDEGQSMYPNLSQVFDAGLLGTQLESTVSNDRTLSQGDTLWVHRSHSEIVAVVYVEYLNL